MHAENPDLFHPDLILQQTPDALRDPVVLESLIVEMKMDPNGTIRSCSNMPLLYFIVLLSEPRTGGYDARFTGDENTARLLAILVNTRKIEVNHVWVDPRRGDEETLSLLAVLRLNKASRCIRVLTQAGARMPPITSGRALNRVRCAWGHGKSRRSFGCMCFVVKSFAFKFYTAIREAGKLQRRLNEQREAGLSSICVSGRRA